MSPTSILADIDLGTLIYIFFVFIWLISNVLGSKKKKKRGGTPIPRPDETSAEAELREFLETLAGKPAEPEPEPVPPPPPATVRRARDMSITPPTPLIFPRPAPAAPMAVPETPSINIEEIAASMRERSSSAMAASFSTTLSSMASLFKTSGLTMPALRYALNSSHARPEKPVLTQQRLSNRAELRRIVAGRIVLGPPRALEPYQADTEATRRR